MKRSPVVSGVLVFLCLMIVACPMTAQVTGKVSGVIVDKKTREPLVGANVQLEGTALGATTNQAGEYFILRIPPGTYSLKATLIGYQPTLVKNVRVLIEHTTQINIDLSEEAVGMDEVVITAERPLVQKDVTSSTQFIGAEEIGQLPVTDAREGLSYQTGVYFDPIPAIGGLGSPGRGEARYSVRGGGQDQVKWFLDGVRTSTPVEGRADRGGSFTNVNMNAIQEIQLITGGFNPEFGEAQSGIVNVVMKEGGNRFFGSLEYIYGPPGQHHFGNYVYDHSTQKEFRDHTLPDGSLDTAWWTPYRQAQIYDYTTIPDHTVYGSFGGPIFTGETARASFFFSGELRREAYTLPHPRNSRNTENLMGNISYIPRADMRFKFTLLYNHEAHSTLQETGDFIQNAKYYRGWGSLLDTYNYSGSVQFTHTLNPALYYEIKLSGYIWDFHEGPSDYYQLGQSKNPDIFGYQRYNNYQNEPYDAWAPVLRSHTRTGDLALVSSLSWQIDRANLLKSGLEARYLTVAEMESYRFPSWTLDPNLWLNRGLNETYHPVQLAAYVQDKMEFESMILNFGVRYDLFAPNRDWFYGINYFNTSIDPLYNAAADVNGDQLDDYGRVKYSLANAVNQPRTPSKPFQMISPRIGVSFPITDATVLHFNYGHFYQMPPVDRMFEWGYFRPEYIVKGLLAQQTDPSIVHVKSNDGDPERVVFMNREPLRPAKTVSFEVGIKHNFSDLAVLEVTGFYKDLYDQTEPRVGIFDRRLYGYDPFRRMTTPNVFYASNFPGDYGDARGFEITLRTLFSQAMTLDLNYSFSRTTQGRGSPGRVYLDSVGNTAYVWDAEVSKRVPTERSYNRPHNLRVNLYFRYPATGGGSFLSTILEGTSASILYRFVSGQAFTYLQPTDPPDTYNNYRYPSSNTVDLRIDKAFKIGSTNEISVMLRVTNLLNAKNVRSIGDIYFDPNAIKNYVEKGQISTVDGGGYDISWQTWYEPRRLYVGIKYVLQ